MFVRRMACESLTFMCYCEQPSGHAMVLRGLELLNQGKAAAGPFERWLKYLGRMLDRHGSPDEPKSAHITSGQDLQLIEYAVIQAVDTCSQRDACHSTLKLGCKHAID